MRVLSLLTAILLGLAACSAWTEAQAPKGKKDIKAKKDKKKQGFANITDVGGKTFEDLVKDIKSLDRSEGTQALKTILLFGPERAQEAIPTILGELKKHHKGFVKVDASFLVNAPATLWAIISNVRRPDPEQVQEIITELTRLAKDPQVVVRYRAIQVLTGFGPAAKSAIPALVLKATDSDTWETRHAAVVALGVVAIEWEAPGEPVKGKGKEKGKVKGKGKVKPKESSQLPTKPQEPKRKLPAPEVTRVLYNRLLNDSSSQVRLAAIRSLESLHIYSFPGKSRTVYEEQMEKAAAGKSTRPLVRIEANLALYDLKKKLNPKRREAIAKFLLHNETVVRGAAIQALAKFGTDSADQLEPLSTLVEDKDKGIGTLAISTIGIVGKEDPRAHKFLADLLGHKDAMVRGAAAKTLGEVGKTAKDTLPALKKALLRPQEEAAVLSFEVFAIGSVGKNDPKVWAFLAGLLGDPQALIRGEAAKTLGAIGKTAKDTLPALKKALLRPKEEAVVRSVEVLAIGSIGKDDPKVRAFLAGLLQDPEALIRSEAAKALGAIGKTAKDTLPALKQALLRPKEEAAVLLQVVWALGNIDGLASLLALQEVRDNEKLAEPVRQAARGVVEVLLHNKSKVKKGANE